MGVLEHRPGAEHCTLSPEEWKDALVASNFSDPMMITSVAGLHLAFIAQGMLAPIQEGSSLSTSIVESTPSIRDMRNHSNSSAVKPFNGSRTLDSAGQDATEVDQDLETLKDGLTVICGYRNGSEIELVKFIAGLNSSQAHILWLHTDTDYNNAKLLGIVRSIRKEYSLWKIMLVLFDPSWSSSRKKAYIVQYLVPLEQVDSEILVGRNGSVYVPRFVGSPEPPKTHRRGTYPIHFDKTAIWRAFPLPLGPNQVEVAVEFVNVAPAFSGYFEFSGMVTDIGSDVRDKALAGRR